MSPEIAQNGGPQDVRSASIDQQLLLLETLQTLLDGAIRCLTGGDAPPLLEMSRQIQSTAQELLALSLQLSRFPESPEAQQRRRKLVMKLGEQRAFCRAMLRRWRRSLALRQQLLGLRGAPALYTDSLSPLELK